MALLTAVATVAGAQSPRSETVASGLEHPWAVAFLITAGVLVIVCMPSRKS